MAIPALNNTPSESGKDMVYNPNSTLDKDAFMQLFLKQLETQDPTNPMDTDKMLEQTAYLGTMEMNYNMQNTIEKLSKSLDSVMQMNTISAIGKIADIDKDYVEVNDEDIVKDFSLYFKNAPTKVIISIKDEDGNLVRTIEKEGLPAGVNNFEWDLKDNNSERVKEGKYYITATYISNNESFDTKLGIYPIEAIKFDNGKAYAKLADEYVEFDKIKEIVQ